MLYLGVEGAERHQRAMEALAAVGLEDREQNHSNQLSGGQQQRVAVARSLVNNPALILADEPTGNLDSRTSVEVMEIFQRLNRQRGITLVLVTHEPDIAQYAKRVVVFKDGKIRKDYPIDQPRNAAEALRNLKLYVPRDQLPEPDTEEFYHADLVGLAAVDTSGLALGRVVAIHNFGAGDLLEIRPDQSSDTVMLPFTEAIVPVVDIAGGRIVVDPPEGTFTDSTATGNE